MLIEPFDFGCRPSIKSTLDGYVLPALVTPIQFAGLRITGRRIDLNWEALPPDRKAAVTISQGDRFDGGRIAPRGLGTRPSVSVDLSLIMNADEIDFATKGLVREYGLSIYSLPNPTTLGTSGTAGHVGGGGVVNPRDYHIYFGAGVHARERGGPDNLIYFIADLLYAQKHRIGLTMD